VRKHFLEWGSLHLLAVYGLASKCRRKGMVRHIHEYTLTFLSIFLWLSFGRRIRSISNRAQVARCRRENMENISFHKFGRNSEERPIPCVPAFHNEIPSLKIKDDTDRLID
jgi:hypothetical protein